MPAQFEYSGVDRSGQPLSGLAEGASPMDAVLRLREAGVTVYSIRKKLIPERHAPKSSGRIHASDLIAFNTQLASLLKTRLPLAESVRHISKEIKSPRLKTSLEEITGQLEAGHSLSESLGYQREQFPPLYISMVEAGEKSGNLAEVLYQVSEHFKSVEDLRRKLVNVLVYPAIVTVLSAGVLVSLIKLMVPPYVDLYSGFHVEFPLSMRILVGAERILGLSAFWIVVGLGVIAAVVALMVFRRRSEALRALLNRFVLRIPFWGPMIRDSILVRSLATLATLLRAGVPLHDSLNIVKNLVSDGPVKAAYDLAADTVAEGAPLSQALVVQPDFPLEIAWVIRNGETRGELVDALDDARRISQSNFEFSSKVILSVLEPALLIAMGIIVVSIAISLFYPLYSIAKYLGT
jgi:type II secretory pathway component PulF